MSTSAGDPNGTGRFWGIGRTRRALLLLSFGLLLPLSLAAETEETEEARPYALVEFASFDCPHCRQITETHKRIHGMAERAGLEIVYAPLPNHGDMAAAWRERTWYAARELPEPYPSEVMQGLFAAQDVRSLRTREEVKAWLQMTVPDVDWGRFIAERVDNRATVAALERAASLAANAGLREYPAWALVMRSGEAELVGGRGDVADRMDELVERLEEL